MIYVCIDECEGMCGGLVPLQYFMTSWQRVTARGYGARVLLCRLFKCKTIPWIYPLKSKPIQVQFNSQYLAVSICMYMCMYVHTYIYIPIYIHVYIFISWSQDDAPWLVQIGEVLVYPCEFIICRTRLIFSFVLCYHWSESVVVPIRSSSLVALEFVRMTTSSAAGGGNFVGMASFLLRCNYHDMYDREISGSL